MISDQTKILEKRMQNSHRLLSLISSALIAATCTSQVFAQSASPSRASTIGLVDRDKVVTSYAKAQQAAEELKKSEEKVHKLIEDSNKQYEDAKNAHKPPAELEGLQRRLQTQIDEEVRKVQTRAQSLESQLEGEIDAAIKAEAANRKVEVVILKQAVPVGGVDLTDGVVKRLTGLATAGANKSSTK